MKTNDALQLLEHISDVHQQKHPTSELFFWIGDQRFTLSPHYRVLNNLNVDNVTNPAGDVCLELVEA